jgi:uncharacterized membrane protein
LNNEKTRKLVFTALIAAVYAVVTMTLYFTSYTGIQFRFAEALTILPFFSSYSILGLFVGCIIANMLSPVGIPDIIFGSLATLIAAMITYYIGRSSIRYKEYIAPLPAVIINAVVVGIMLYFVYGLPLILTILQVGFGELVCCYALGLPLLLFINKNKHIRKFFI